MAITANVGYKLRREVYRRDGYRCALCDSTRYLQLHHVIPRGQGGPTDNPHNLITLCSDCHALAHGLDLREIGENDGCMEQAIAEYMADYYAQEGQIWNPWGHPKKPMPWRDNTYPHGQAPVWTDAEPPEDGP